jgi:hypothetical protein
VFLILPQGGGPAQQFVSRHEIQNAITIDSRQHYGGQGEIQEISSWKVLLRPQVTIGS